MRKERKKKTLPTLKNEYREQPSRRYEGQRPNEGKSPINPLNSSRKSATSIMERRVGVHHQRGSITSEGGEDSRNVKIGDGKYSV